MTSFDIGLVWCRSRFLVSDWETLAENILCIKPYLASGNQTYVAMEHLPCILEFFSLYPSIHCGFSIAMFDYLRVLVTYTLHLPTINLWAKCTSLEPKESQKTIFWSWLCPSMVPFSAIWMTGKSRWRDSKFKAYWYLAGNGWVAGGCWDDYY